MKLKTIILRLEAPENSKKISLARKSEAGDKNSYKFGLVAKWESLNILEERDHPDPSPFRWMKYVRQLVSLLSFLHFAALSLVQLQEPHTDPG